MNIKTKKFKLDTKTYIKLGMTYVLFKYWWVLPIFFAIILPTFWIKTIWFVIFAILCLALYIAFWFIQYYGVTYLGYNKILFEPLQYEISNNQILMQINTKQGMPIVWTQVKKVYVKKNYFLIIVSKVHFIYLPYKIFNAEHEIKIFEAILKRNKLIK
jgi:hypothetical protein